MSGGARRPERRTRSGAGGDRGVRVIAGRRAVAEALHAGGVDEVIVVSGSRRTPGLDDVLAVATEAGVRVREADRVEVDALAQRNQGVVALARGGAASELGERDLDSFPLAPGAFVVVLDGIEDPQNLGAAARSAEAAGAALLISRTRRAAAVTPAAVRASAGALLHVPHARVANISRALDRLRARGFVAVGLDGSAPRSIFDEPCPQDPVAVVIGSEARGLSRLVKERCDALVALPMNGRLGSLNASAALAAVLYAYVLPSREA